MAVIKTGRDLLEKMIDPRIKMQWYGLPIKIRRYYTDTNGVILNKLAVPAALQKPFPIYLFGEMDRQGAYSVAQKAKPRFDNSYFYLMNYVNGVNNPYIFGFTGSSTLQGQLTPGDIVTVYVDNLIAPNYFIFIVYSVSNISLASLLYQARGEFKEKIGFLNVERINYYTDNENQFLENLLWTYIRPTGEYSSDIIDPSIYRRKEDEQQGFICLRNRFVLNQFLGINFYMDFQTNNIELVLRILKDK